LVPLNDYFQLTSSSTPVEAAEMARLTGSISGIDNVKSGEAKGVRKISTVTDQEPG